MKRILYLTGYPSPYRVEFLDILGKSVDITALFADRKEDQKHRSKEWFVQGEGCFKSVQLEKKVLSTRVGNLCLDVIKWLNKPWDAIVVCGYSSPTMILAIAWLRMRRIPFWMAVDGGLIRSDSRAMYLFKKMLVSSADYYLSSGKETTRYLVHYGARAQDVYEYPFSALRQKDILKEPPSQSEKQKLREKLGMTEKKNLLYVGRYDPQKGMEDLLYAIPELDKDCGVYFVGGNPTREHLDWCRENGVTNAHFVGFTKKDALAEYYKAADVLVLPTWSDVWGLVVNEAMSFGLPVITTDQCVAGVELVREGENGYIIPAKDREALAASINRLFTQDYRQMGANALEIIRPYTIENMAKIHVDIFNRQEK